MPGKEKIIVKYRSTGEVKEYCSSDITLDVKSFCYDMWSQPGILLFSRKYDNGVSRDFVVDGKDIEEVIFKDFDFTLPKTKVVTAYIVRDGVALTFDHCRFDEMGPFCSALEHPWDRQEERNGSIVFDHCTANYADIYSEKFLMRGVNVIRGCLEANVSSITFQEGIVKVLGKRDFDLEIEPPDFKVHADEITFDNSFVDTPSLKLTYEKLDMKHSSISSLEYCFNDEAWKFRDKKVVSTDDPNNKLHLVRNRLIEVLKKGSTNVNKQFNVELASSFQEIDAQIASKVSGYQTQIDALERKKQEAYQESRSLKQEKTRVLSNKNALGFLPPK